MKRFAAHCPKNSLTMSLLAIIIPTTLLLLVKTTAVQGQQQRFFLPSTNNGNFGIPRAQFQDDTESVELITPQRRVSAADPSPLSNPASSSSFFTSQQQLPPGTFTNSGPFSRPPNAQQFILNGQTQFQPIRNSGSLSFSDAASSVPQPSFFQQAPIQRPQQQQQPVQQQQFNFFPSSSQQQRFRPIVQQQPRTEQPESIENFDDNQNPLPSLIPQQSSQERFNSDSSRRPLSQSNGISPGARNPPSAVPIRWWNPGTADSESGAVNGDDESVTGFNTKDEVLDFNQQRQNQPPKRGRGQPQQAKRRPVTTSVPSSVPSLEEQQEPAAIGFTVIHDENDDRSSWSQPIITTHRPQSGQTFRNRNSPTVNRRPTTYNPLSAVTTSTIRSPAPLSVTFNRQQPTTVRSRKSSLFTTSTASPLEDDDDDDDDEEEEIVLEEKRQFFPRKNITTTSTTQSTPVPITTLRSPLRPRLNTPVASSPQQQRMKKIVNNPAIIQSIITRKPTLTTSTTTTTTTTTTLAPTTTTANHEIAEEYEEYEDVEYTTSAYTTTTELPTTKKLTKVQPVTQPATIIQKTQPTNISTIGTTESWFVVASVQTSRSVSSSSNSGGGANKNLTMKEASTSTTVTPTTKHRFNNKPTITTTSTTTVESIIDKLDRVQSELSNGILYGSSSNTNNSSRILTDMQNSGNNDDKRNDVIIPLFTTPNAEKTTVTTISTTMPTTTTTTTTTAAATTTTTTAASTTSTARTTTSKDENEDEDKEEEDGEESEDSDKETSFVRKFVPSKQRTSTVPTITTVSTLRSVPQAGKKKSLVDSVKFDELLTSGLLPAGFNPKPPPAYKSKTITTTTTETSLPVTSSKSITQPSTSSSSTTLNTTPSSSSTTVKSKLPGLNIKFVDDSSALASLLPPGFKLEDTIKPVEILSPSLLPPGFKPPAENVDTTIKNKEPEEVSTTVMSKTEVPLSATTATASSSTTGLVFPNSGKGINSSGTRKPLPSSKKMQASVTTAPIIQRGWPVRASTEFTGWSTPSTTPLSIDKLLEQSKASDLAALMTSTAEPTTSSTTTTTTTTTTMKPPPTTTPGQCSESDSVCELVGTVRLVGSGSEKWVPELLDHNTAEWRSLANDIEIQLDKVYSKSPALSKWYKKITIDSFSPGSNAISNGKSDKNAGVLVDFFVQLNQLGRTVSTADIRRLFHETLQKEGNLGSSAQPLQYGNGGDYDGLYLKLGRFTVDPARTDFIVLPKPTRGVTATAGTDDAWLPQWAVAVMVIGLGSLLFVLIFGITVLVSRNKSNKKVPPPTLQPSMITEDHQQHIYGTGKNGPTSGSRHMLHHPPSHSNSNYNISSYGYDNYAIDDDMMMLDEDDLEDVDRLYDMDAVWTDHDHDKLKIPQNGTGKKHRDTQHAGHYDSWRSTALAPQTLSPVQTGYYTGGGSYGYGAEPNGYGGERRHYHREASSATNPRSHHHYPSSHHNPGTSYTTGPRKPPQQYHPDYDTDF